MTLMQLKRAYIDVCKEIALMELQEQYNIIDYYEKKAKKNQIIAMIKQEQLNDICRRKYKDEY